MALPPCHSNRAKNSSKMPSREMNISTTPNFFLTFTDTELVLSSTWSMKHPGKVKIRSMWLILLEHLLQTICDLTLQLGVQQTKTINSTHFTFPCTWSLFTFWETTCDSTNSKSLSFLISLMQFREKYIKPCNSSAVACHLLLNFSLNKLPYALHAGQFQHTTTLHKLGNPVIK